MRETDSERVVWSFRVWSLTKTSFDAVAVNTRFGASGVLRTCARSGGNTRVMGVCVEKRAHPILGPPGVPN